VTKYTGHAQIQDAIFALFQKGGLFDPATNPQWKLDRLVKLADNSASFVISGEFQSFNIPYLIVNFVIDSNCQIAVESSYGRITPIEK